MFWWENVHDYTSIDAKLNSFSSSLLIFFAAADVDTTITGLLVLGVIIFFCLITTIAGLGAQHQSLPQPRCGFVLCARTKKQRKNRNTATGIVPTAGTSAMEGLMDDTCTGTGTSGLAIGSNAVAVCISKKEKQVQKVNIM